MNAAPYGQSLISLARTFMTSSVAIVDSPLRQAFRRQARPSGPQRTACVRIGASRICATGSRRGSAISQRTVMDTAG